MFEQIKQIAPSVIYLHGNDETVPPPVDADTANMVFVEAGGYAVGFTSLTDEERIAVTALLDGNEQVFHRIRATTITADDILVESRDIKEDADEAFAEALEEAKKKKGQAKSLDLISRSMLKKMEQFEKRLKKIEKAGQ